MGAGRNRRHQNDMARKDMEQRQWADDVVMFREQQSMPDPAVVNDARIGVLRHLRHTRGAARVEIRRDAVPRTVGKIKAITAMPLALSLKIQDACLVRGSNLGPNQRHHKPLEPRQIA